MDEDLKYGLFIVVGILLVIMIPVGFFTVIFGDINNNEVKYEGKISRKRIDVEFRDIYYIFELVIKLVRYHIIQSQAFLMKLQDYLVNLQISFLI